MNLFKNKSIVLLLLSLSIAFSCSDDKVLEAPNIVVTSDQFDETNTYTGTNEEMVRFSASIEALNSLKTATVVLLVDNASHELQSLEIDSDGISQYDTGEISFEILDEYLEKSVTVEITAIDYADLTTTVELFLTARGKFQTGVFIVNEGSFLAGNASVSHFDPTSGTVTNNVYFTENDQLALGDVAQSMSVEGNFGFVVVNNSNTVEIVNAHTFKQIKTFQAALPRFFKVTENKGYLTEWVSFTDPGRVNIIDLDTYQSETTVTVGSGAENLTVHDGILYVSNSFQSDVSVIDLSTNQETKKIEVGNSPGELIVIGSSIWVVCGGGSDANWNPLNDGKLVEIGGASQAVSKTIELNSNVSKRIASNASGLAIYYFKGTNIFKVETSATEAPTSAFIEEANATSFYGIGVNPETDVIYISDSNGFQSNGKVFRYNADGTTIDNFTVGIGPNGFVFK